MRGVSAPGWSPMPVAARSGSVPRDLTKQVLLLPILRCTYTSVRAQPLHQQRPVGYRSTETIRSSTRFVLARPSRETGRRMPTMRWVIQRFCPSRYVRQVCRAASEKNLGQDVVGRETAPSLDRWRRAPLPAELRLGRCEPSLKRAGGGDGLQRRYALLLRNGAKACARASIS